MDAALDDAADVVVDATAATLEVVADVVDGAIDLMAPTQRGRRRRRLALLLVVVVAVVAVVLAKRRGDGDD
ncbi:MAG: hypothetical protein AAGF02_19375 [Actinomycetota bacterium]